jgi:hypothetical protein
VLDSNDRHDRIKKSHMKHHNKSWRDSFAHKYEGEWPGNRGEKYL